MLPGYSFFRSMEKLWILNIDARGYRVDFHALRHTSASLLAAANVSELARMKLALHTEWKMTDRYTDSQSIPLFAEMNKLAAILPSQLAS